MKKDSYISILIWLYKNHFFHLIFKHFHQLQLLLTVFKLLLINNEAIYHIL